MRISDWSSDVCSSDLPRHRPAERDAEPAAYDRCASLSGLCEDRALGCGGVEPAGHLPDRRLRKPDRKSVVSGKSVYVRVDVGGRRVIKNTKKNINKNSNMLKV